MNAEETIEELASIQRKIKEVENETIIYQLARFITDEEMEELRAKILERLKSEWQAMFDSLKASKD